MPIDDLYSDSTSSFLSGSDQVNVPMPQISPSTSISSIARAVGRGVGQGGVALFGAAADAVAGLSQLYVDPDSLAGSPDALQAADQQVNDALAKARAGHLFESRVGAAAYDLADTLKADPSKTTAIDQVVQGAVSGLTQILPAAALLGPLGGAAVGAGSIGMQRAEDLKRQGVDVGTRTAVGAVEGAATAAGALVPVAGSTLASTAGLALAGGPGLAVGQAAAERAILRGAGYDHLADQIDPLDPVNLAAATLMTGVVGGAHYGLAARAARAAGAAGSAPLQGMALDARKALRFDDPAIDAYAVQAAQANGVPPSLMLALKNAGERSNPTAVSPKGAAGVAQLMPENQAKFGVTDPSDPVQSLDGMAKYLAETMKQYNGNLQAVIADYNGGPRAAEAVMAGKAPQAETAAYLQRVNDYLQGQGLDHLALNPTAAQVDAALMAHGQRIVDDAWVFGSQSDPAGLDAHQAAFELAARQMNDGGFPDVSRYFAQDDVARASALDGLIAELESHRVATAATASNLAERGGIAQAREELSAVQAAAPDSSDAAVKDLARQIQSTGARYQAAAARAQKLIDAQVEEHAAKVQRLQEIIQRNAEAQRATQALPGIDQQLEQLRAARGEIDVPATRRTPLADFVQRLGAVQRERVPTDGDAQSIEFEAAAPDAAPRVNEPERITRQSLSENGSVNVRAAAASIEQRVRAALMEGRDVTLYRDGAQHSIVDYDNGMLDSTGGQWQAMDLLQPPAPGGELPRLEIGSSARGQPDTTTLIESNLRNAAADAPERRVYLDAPADTDNFSSANPREAEFDGNLHEALDLIDREHAETVAGSRLFQVAAQCFLTLGE